MYVSRVISLSIYQRRKCAKTLNKCACVRRENKGNLLQRQNKGNLAEVLS